MRIIVLCLLAALLSQCTSTPKSSGPHSDVGVWLGKVQMVNRTTNNKKWANVTWVSDSSSNRMRVDVSAILDVPIATFLMDGDKTHLWLFTEQKYFHSDDPAKLFRYLTKFSLDPKIFYSLLGTPRPPSSQWSCKDKEDSYHCQYPAEKTRFSVNYEDVDKRIIKVLKGSKALQLRLSRSKVQVDEAQFKPLSTSHFKTQKI